MHSWYPRGTWLWADRPTPVRLCVTLPYCTRTNPTGNAICPEEQTLLKTRSIRARPRRGYHNHQQPQQTKQSSFDHVVFICASFTRLMEWQSFIVSAIVPAGIGGIRSTDGSWICCTGQCLATHLSGGWPWPRAAGLPICVPGAGRRIIKSSRCSRVGECADSGHCRQPFSAAGWCTRGPRWSPKGLTTMVMVAFRAAFALCQKMLAAAGC
jgi:hypothetical protein